jgi:SAM-dependent methyltransferase
MPLRIIGMLLTLRILVGIGLVGVLIRQCRKPWGWPGYSTACVAVSRATNAAGIAAGRVEVREGSVSRLPFPDAAFDLVTAVETHYYWPDLAANVREVLRVLKPGARFIIIAELYKHRRHDVHSLVMKPLGGVVLTADEHRDLLSAGGYADVAVETSKLGWICAIGRRPSNR